MSTLSHIHIENIIHQDLDKDKYINYKVPDMNITGNKLNDSQKMLNIDIPTQ